MSLVDHMRDHSANRKISIIHIISVLLCSLSALCVAFGQPSQSPLLCFIAAAMGYIPIFLVAMRQSHTLIAFLYCMLWSFVVTLIELSWMSATTYHGIYILVVYAALSLALALEFGLIIFFVRSLDLIRCIGGACFWFLIEWSRLYFLCGFAFKPIGLSLSGSLLSLQLASVGGIYGLSFWVMLTNLVGCLAFQRRNHRHLAFWALLVVAPYLFGFVRLQLLPQEEGPYLRTLLVQTALRPDEKIPLAGGEQFIHPIYQWENIIHLIEEAREQADLIVLPESAVPFSARKAFYRAKSFHTFTEKEEEISFLSNLDIAAMLAKRSEADLLIGLDDVNDLGATNSAFLISKSKIWRYDKQILVPLAEYIPFSWLKPMVARYGITSFFAHGQSRVLEGKLKYGPTICYEECFPHLVRRYKQEGAQLLVNLTNDSYFPNSKLPRAHFDLGRVRAVENGLPLLRCCNTGITAAIDAKGSVLAKLEGESVKGALFVKVPLRIYQTLYTLVGDAPLILFSLFYLVSLTSFHLLKKRGASKFLENNNVSKESVVQKLDNSL